ncbi:hypothetical protein MRX96_029938 [Rhipicephalus microplus]
MALNAATDQQYHLLDQDGTADDQMDQLQGDHDTGHLLLLTGGDPFLDVWSGGPADPGGLGRSGWPWRPPDAGRRLVRVYRSFLAWLFACRLQHAWPGRQRLLTTSSGPGHRRDRIAVVACRPNHPVLPSPAAAVRSCCPPDPPTWILPARVPRVVVIPGGATLLPLPAPRLPGTPPLLSDLGPGLRIPLRRDLHCQRPRRRPRRERLVQKHRRLHALPSRCNHDSRS